MRRQIRLRQAVNEDEGAAKMAAAAFIVPRTRLPCRYHPRFWRLSKLVVAPLAGATSSIPAKKNYTYDKRKHIYVYDDNFIDTTTGVESAGGTLPEDTRYASANAFR